jgi:Tn3 transposase DDE domain
MVPRWWPRGHGAGGVRVTTRRGEPWVTVPPMDKQPEPPTLQALKDEVERRWGTIDLLDMLKDADYLTGFSQEFASVASREITNRAVLRKRLLLVLFALGTNMGVRRVVATGADQHGETEATLRRVRRLYVNRDNLRRAITRLVNATFAVRDTGLWSTASSSPSSDSTAPASTTTTASDCPSSAPSPSPTTPRSPRTCGRRAASR